MRDRYNYLFWANRRTARTAYWQDNNLAVPEIPQEPPDGSNWRGTGFTRFAKGALRASVVAYTLLVGQYAGGVPPDPEPTPGQPLCPVRADAPRRAASSAYQASLASFVVDDVVVAEDLPEGVHRQSVTAQAPAAQRAANPAYTIFLGAGQNILTGAVSTPYQEHEVVVGFASGPPRAAQEAYRIQLAIFATPEPPELLPAGANVLPERAAGPPRAARSAYDISSGREQNILTGQVDASEGALRVLFPDRAYGPQRASNSVYSVLLGREQNILTGDVSLPAQYRQSVTESAPGHRRAANHAYWIGLGADQMLVGIAEDLPEGVYRQILPEAAPGPRRAQNAAYWVGLGVEQNILTGTVSTPHQERQAITEFARVAQRAAQSAYRAHLSTFVIPDEPSEDERPLLPERAPGQQRAQNSAYWVGLGWQENILAGQVDAAEGALRVAFPDRALGPRRAQNAAYWIGSGWEQNILTGEVLPVEASFRQSITEFARGPQRAANHAYWIGLGWDQNVLTGEVLPAPYRQLLPERAPGHHRAANESYWLDLGREQHAIQGPVDATEGSLRPLLPSVAPGPRRAANSAYSITLGREQNILTGQVDTTEASYRQVVPERASGPRRAAAEAYRLLYPTFVVPPVPPAGERVFPDRALGAARAARSAYDLALGREQNVLTGTVGAPAQYRQSITDFASGPRRAANWVYWFPNGLEGVVPPDVPIGTEVFPETRGTFLFEETRGVFSGDAVRDVEVLNLSETRGRFAFDETRGMFDFDVPS